MVKLEGREGAGLGGGYLDIRPCTPGTRRTALNDESVDTCNDDDVDKKIVGNSHCDIIYTDIAQPELLRSHLTHLSHFIYRSLSSCGGGGGSPGCPLSRSRVSSDRWVQVKLLPTMAAWWQ